MRGWTRLYHLFESIQYAVLYMLSAFAGGVGLDFLFPVYDKNKQTWTLFREVTGQCLLLVLLVYFIRIQIKSVPLLFPIDGAPSNYVPYRTAEFNGEMMMGFVFLSSQLNLLNKIDLLSKRLYKWMFNEERVVEVDVKQEERKLDGILRHGK